MKSNGSNTYQQAEVSSLKHIGETLLAQMERLDITSGGEYLLGLKNIVAPLQLTLDNARKILLDLIAKATIADDIAALVFINKQLVSSAADIFLSLPSVPVVQEFCTTVRDAIAERTLELSRRELFFSGTCCEVPLALFAVGSDGRSEQSLYVDQDYLFLYGSEDSDISRSEEEVDTYFGMLGSVFMTRLDEIGIRVCSGGIMPVNEEWRGSLQQWQERIARMLQFERTDWEKNILSLVALMDARFVCGDSELGRGFGAMLHSSVRNKPDAIRHMARVVSSMKLSRGFLNRFTVEADGPRKGSFNLKLLAWMPLVMCVRLLAVNLGIEETSTLARLNRLKDSGHLTDRMAAALSEAYLTITGHRIRLQTMRLKRVIDDDSYINPYELPSQEREELKTAISRIDELQNMLRSRFSMVTSVDRILNLWS